MSPAGSSNAPSEMAVTPGGNDVGFLIVNAVLALSETARLLRTLEASPLTRSRAGAHHLMKHPAVSDVATPGFTRGSDEGARAISQSTGCSSTLHDTCHSLVIFHNKPSCRACRRSRVSISFLGPALREA